MADAKIQEGEEVAQTERIGLGDFVIAGLVAAATCFLLSWWEFPGLHPSAWSDAVVASGVRPAANVAPGFWRFVAWVVYSVVGYGTGNHILRLLGHFSIALIAFSVYCALREMLAFIMRTRPQFSRRRTAVMQLAAAVGSLAFAFSDPVWSAGQCFSETTILIVLAIGAVEAFFVFLRKGTLGYSYICALCAGLLAAESPVGLVLAFAFVLINQFVLKIMPTLESPFFKPAVIAVGKWHMTFVFIAALLFGIALNCTTYVLGDGLSAIGQTAGHVPMAYLLNYWGRVTGAADSLGWVLFASVCLAPFVVAMVRFPDAADEEKFLPYSTGIVFLVSGVICVSQFCSLPSLWFWSYGAVESRFLLSLGMLLAATNLAGAVTILGVDALCRNHARLARQMFGNDDAPEPAEPAAKGRPGLISGACMVVVPAMIVATMLPGRIKSGTREMLGCIAEGVAEIVTECGDAEYAFTDGNLDAAIELESHARGGSLKCLSLMRNSTAMAAHLATRGMENDSEDKFCFRHDCGMGLRSWMRDRPEKLAKSAVLMGFDLWKRDGKAIPPIGGMLSRPVDWSEKERQDGIVRAKALAKRILALHRSGSAKDCTDPTVRRALSYVQWRLARACIYRAERLDLAGDAAAAVAEQNLAEELNKCNEVFQNLLAANERHRQTLLQRLTPREGLQLALVRADFGMGKAYAETILGVDPEHPDANFAMGMYYQRQGQYNRAETYLKRCLVRNPKEPAYYNNLAMLQIELGKLEAAEINAQKALKIIPDSDEVKDTLKRVRAAIEKRKKAPPQGAKSPKAAR